MNTIMNLVRAAEANVSPAADRRDWLQPTPPRRSIDLTATPGLRGLIRGRWFLGTLRWLTGLLLVLGIYAAVFKPTVNGGFAVAVFWGLFWPFFTALVTPTVGCTGDPDESTNLFAQWDAQRDAAVASGTVAAGASQPPPSARYSWITAP